MLFTLMDIVRMYIIFIEKKRYVNHIQELTFHFNHNKKILTKYKINIE